MPIFGSLLAKSGVGRKKVVRKCDSEEFEVVNLSAVFSVRDVAEQFVALKIPHPKYDSQIWKQTDLETNSELPTFDTCSWKL
jgi:hypothetical protein